MTDVCDAPAEQAALADRRVATTGIGQAIAGGIQDRLAQPGRAIVQQFTIAPRERPQE